MRLHEQPLKVDSFLEENVEWDEHSLTSAKVLIRTFEHEKCLKVL